MKFKLIFTMIALIMLNSLVAAEKTQTVIKKTTADDLYKTIAAYAKNVEVKNNVISFQYKNINLYCVWDEKADRMRMLSPIASAENLSEELIITALKANYHTALDARYAIGDDVLYSVFIHPLSPITKLEIESAIRQVATAALTFGTTFTSGELVFPGNSDTEQPADKKQNEDSI